jgi:prepilin-type N-terminal cleavage/methylation domain-containing protein
MSRLNFQVHKHSKRRLSMKNLVQTVRTDEQGFTLVELAVVMVIIGVLIGGILKGQELITNARVTSTISQFEALSAAKNDFQNQYSALPGDMQNANTRLSNCGGATANQACIAGGDGSGRLNNGVGITPAANEGVAFFGQLLAADYITGMTGATAGGIGFGTTLPLSPLGGGFYAGDANGAGTVGFPALRAGMYVTLVGAANAVVANGSGIISGVQAARMDTKLDDGVGTSGTFYGDSGVLCQDAAGAYSPAVASTCSVAYRIQ